MAERETKADLIKIKAELTALLETRESCIQNLEQEKRNKDSQINSLAAKIKDLEFQARQLNYDNSILRERLSSFKKELEGKIDQRTAEIIINIIMEHLGQTS